MDTRLNIFTKIEQVEFIPISPCHGQFIGCHHYCLSLARPNDMKIIIMQEGRGLSWNLQPFLFNRRRQGKMGSLLVQRFIHMRATQQFHRGFLLSKTRIKTKNSEKQTEIFLEFLVFFNKQLKSKNETNYFHGKAPNKQKKNKEIFLDFSF